MSRLEIVCRVLRDFGLFLLGIAAITVAIDHLFVHPDPMREMQRAFNRSVTEDLEKTLRQPDTTKHSDSGSEAQPFETSSYK